MGADDTQLTVRINAETGESAPKVLSVSDALIALQKAYDANTGSATIFGSTIKTAHDDAGKSAEKHAEAESVLGASLGKVETATNSAARAFSAIGFQTGEATERITGFTEALEGLGAAAPELLILGAAALTVATAFGFLKEGIDEAAKAQVAMASIGQAVRNQGGAFDEAAKGGLENFLDSLERATTYSRGEALDAINSLTSAGTSLSDSEKIVAIATDVAAGSHRSLTEVIGALKEAEAGRGQGLVLLDGKLKDLVHTHADLSQVLDQLSSDFAGQASDATNTFAGKTEQLKNELAHLGEELGDHLLPFLTTGTEILIGFADEAEGQIPKWARWGEEVVKQVDAVRDAFKGIDDFFKPLSDVLDTLNDISQGKSSTNVPDLDYEMAHPGSVRTLSASSSTAADQGGVPDLDWEMAHPGQTRSMGSSPSVGSKDAIADAISAAAESYSKESGLTAARLDSVITAIGQQETNLGKSSAYDASKGRDRDRNNLGRGIFQLDPASGASASELDKVSTNVGAAANKATEMLVANLKRSDGNLTAAIEAYGPHLKDGSPDFSYVQSVMKRINNAGKGTTGIPFLDNAQSSGQILSDHAGYDLNRSRSQALQHDVAIGNEKGGSTNSLQTPSPEDSNALEKYTELQKSLEASLRGTKDSELLLSAAVRNTTDETEKGAAKQALANAESYDAQKAIGLLTNVRQQEQTELDRLRASQRALAEQQHADYVAYTAYVAAHKDNPTKDEREEAEKLGRTYEASAKLVKENADQVQRLTGFIETNTHAIADNRAHLDDWTIPVKATTVDGALLDEQIARLGLGISTNKTDIDAWSLALKNAKAALDALLTTQGDKIATGISKDFVDQSKAEQKRKDDDAQLADEEKTYKLSTAQQIAFYEKQYELLVESGQKDSAEALKIYGELDKLRADDNKKRVDDEEAFIAKISGYEQTFVDDVVSKHKSLRDSLKDVWNEILADYVQMIESMILKSSLFNALNKDISSIFGVSIGGSGSPGAGSSGLGALASLFPGSGSSPTPGTPAAGIDTPGSNPIVDIGSLTTDKLATSLAPTVAANGQFDSSDSVMNAVFKNLDKGDAGKATSAQSYAGQASSVAGRVGGAVGGAVGIAQGYSQGGVGGGLEAGTGALSLIEAIAPHFGPWGLAIAGAIGIGAALIHHDDPAKMPDKYDTQNYGQGVADLTGKQAGANGQTFYTQQSVSTATGGSGEIGYIEKSLASGTKNADGSFTLANGTVLNPAQYQQYLSTFGSSATGSGQLQFGKDIGQQWITGANGASSSAQSYKDIDALAQEFLSTSGAGTANSAIPVFSISRSYPDMQKASLNANGTYNEATGAYTGAAASTATQPEAAISVNITGNTTIAGAGGMKEFGATIVDAVSQAMQRRNSGQLPGGLRANPLRRRFGNV